MRTMLQAPPIAESQLADAFTAFIGAANRLEDSHRHLHCEVAELRKQLEERNRALASSVAENERMRIALREILDALSCGVAVLDTEREEVVLLNPESRKLLGLPDAAGWDSLPLGLRTSVNALRGEPWENGYAQEITIEKSQRKVCLAIRCSWMTSPRADGSSSDASCLVLIINDVTAHKSAEREREKSRNIVALAEMATVLAHEIRNPLGSLELLAGCLAADPGFSEESGRCIQHLRAGVRFLSATVNNVLRFHNDPGPQHMPALDLATVLRGSVEFIRPMAEQKGVNLALLENLNHAKIAGDSNGLRQLILNLACNALRHTKPGGKITIAATIEIRLSDKVAVIEFADTGSGIRAEDLPHIFRVGFTTTGQTPGLGLTICQQIVEQHGGTITVLSQLGRGTTFRMEFPAL
jgi:signal transduction histidine kinase